MDKAEIQVLVHIPKTAGSTLVHVMQRQFRPDEVLSYEDRFWADSIRELPERAATGLPGIRCVMGHTPFGLHRLVDRPVAYVTMLRDPVEWTLSLFSFIHERHGKVPDGPQRPQWAVFGDVTRMNLEEFLDFIERTNLANLQTRFLAGELDLRSPLPPYPPLGPGALEAAQTNLLASCTTFGLVEHFDLSLLLLRKRLGWGRVFYRRANVTERRMARTEVPAETLARMLELNADDVRLHEFASQAFQEKVRESGLGHPAALKAFRAGNVAYRWLGAGVRRLRKLAR